ncbi:MFS general substrate transporter [Sarocladium strictum]
MNEKNESNTAYAVENETAMRPPPPSTRISAHTILAVLAVNVIYFAQLVNLVGAGAQAQTIAAALGEPNNTVWILGPITIMTVTFGPIVSQAADFWGRRWFLIILTVMGGIGCLIVALAQSMGMLIAGFTILGTAYGTQPLLHAVTSEVLPRRWRGVGQATNMISNSLGSAVALIGGSLMNRSNDPTSDGFRHFYYMTMAFFFFGAVLCFFTYHPALREKQSLPLSEKLASLDWVGYALLSIGLALFCMALSWSDNPYRWSNPHVCATFAVSVTALLGIAVYETWIRKDGMFHHRLFTHSGNKNFAICILCVFTEGAAFFAVNSHLAFQITILYETDGLIVGVRYTIAFITASLGAYFAGWYVARYKHARWITVVAFGIFVVFFVLMATSTRNTSLAVWFYPILMGWALGMTLTTLVTIAQISTPPDLIAIATGLMLSFRAVGGAIGLTCYHALFNAQLHHLGDNIAKEAIPAGLEPQNLGHLIGAINDHNKTDLGSIPGITPTIIKRSMAAFLDTFMSGFRSVWIAGGCFVALTTIISFFLVDRAEDYDMHVDAPIDAEPQQSSEQDKKAVV